MNIEEVYNLCVLHEKLKSGQRSCKDINKIYVTLPGVPKSATKNKKIQEINKYFDTLADNTIKRYLINKQINEKGSIQEDK